MHCGVRQLLEQVASGRSDEDVVATLAGRLAALNRKLDDVARANVEAVAGVPRTSLAGCLVDGLDIEKIESAVAAVYGASTTDAQAGDVEERLRETALGAFDDPALRKLLIELTAMPEIVIDEISGDVVISSAFWPFAELPGARTKEFAE